jgi:hypothetical protein
MAPESKVGRNSPCPCGSGKKHKQCCLGKVEVVQEKARIGSSIAVGVVGLLGGVALGITKGLGFGLAGVAAGIIAAGAVYVFRDPNPPRGGSGGDSSAINFGK